jgi:uncharacterized DUF497 family protein
MPLFDWNPEKNRQLREERGVSFEDVETAIEEGKVLDDIAHPSPARPNQRILVVEIRDYVFLVPYVRDGNRVFLKTVFPSRKAQRKYLGK